ncbi:phospholipase-like, aminotransferase-like mobile domain protein [Tanacetum coccineum]|uniref:Phospholipase-like, aminotransferase-like mobile domain protein n=1 Tax=Tanacetum coccineum TaxID=301880 RepID=A0ABQ5BVG2_9ASTR
MGHELGSVVDDVFLIMVEDLDVWNDFSWGEHMWRELYGAIRNVNLNHQQGHHKALEMNPNFVPTYSLSGFLLSFKIWILESSCVIDHWWCKRSEEIPRGCSWSKHFPFQNWENYGQLFPEAQSEWFKRSTDFFKMYTPRAPPIEYGGLFCAYLKKLSLARTRREKDGDVEFGCQTSTKEVSLKDHVKAMEVLCTSLMILPKEIKSLKACVYKLETIINVILKKESNLKHKVSTPCQAVTNALDDLVDENGVVEVEKDLSEDDGLKVQKLEAENKRLAEQRRIRFHKMKEQENDMKSSYFSNSTHMKLALEKCGTNKRKFANVLRPPVEEDTYVKVLSIDTLKKQNNVLDQYMIEKCQQLKPWGEEDLTRPFNCIDKVYCNFVLEQFLIKSSWRHCKFPWCNDISVDGRFWDALIGLDDKRLGWLLDDVFIPINEPKRHWSLAQFHIQSGNVTFYDSQNIEGVEYRLWYLKMRSCLETKLPVLLHRTGVFASKGIDPNSYSIKFSQEQNVPPTRWFIWLAYGIPLAVEDPIQMALAYREKMVKFYFKHKIICPS